MKSSRDRAIDIMCDWLGRDFSRVVILAQINDDSEGGKNLRKIRDAIERGIEADRREARASVAPS